MSTDRTNAARNNPLVSTGPGDAGHHDAGRRGAHTDWQLAIAAAGPDADSPIARSPGTAPPGRSLWTLQSPAGPALLPRRDEPKSGSWHVLRHRRFLGYFVGSLASNLGTWLQNTAQMLLAYQMTHSPFAVGLVTSAQFAGFLFLGPWAAPLAQRVGSKRVLIASQVVSSGIAALLAVLQFSGSLTESELTLCALGIGLAFTFALPVQTAMVPALVPKNETKAALAMNSVSYNAGRTLAPILCVAVITSMGAGWAFALNAISFIVFALTIIILRPRSASAIRRPNDWLGLRIAVWRPRILLLLLMVAAVTVADDPILVLGPSLAHHVLAVASVWPAYFLSALGLGTVLGAMLPTKTPTARRTAVPLLGLGVSVVVFAAGISAWLSLLAAMAAGVAGLLTGAAAQTLLLKNGGPRQATQIMALWAIAWAGSKPIASLADGWLADHIGVFRAGVVLAAPAMIIALLELFLWPRVRYRLKDRIRQHAEADPAVRTTL